ncbi:MAG: SBBP repeat-containing protein [Bacteroidetes bacterium]|nr:SBBP repeat-containing protein [Bacteroidota bacterium]
MSCKILLAQNVYNIASSRPQLIYENKGQIQDQSGQPRPDIKAFYGANGFKFFLRTEGFSFELFRNQQTNGVKKENTGYESERVDIEFVRANQNPVLTFDSASNYFETYFNDHLQEEGLRLNGFRKLTAHNVWNGIDIEFLVDENSPNQFKYNFIIHPHADLSQIKLQYKGAEVTCNKNILTTHMQLGEIVESIPLSYYLESRSEELPVLSYSISKKKQELSFLTSKKINPNKTLIIDPVVKWSTYYGGNGDDDIGDVTNDSNHIYITGTTNSSKQIASSGAFKGSNNNNLYIAFLVKLNKQNQRIWGTYIGSTFEVSRKVIVDPNGNLYIAGYTSSLTAMGTQKSYQSQKYNSNANTDGFLAKFTGNCKRVWSTYFGGENYDYIYDLAADSFYNLYIVGATYSDSNIALGNSYQVKKAGNKSDQDAFMAKFDSSGVPSWSSYLGGTQIDFGNCISVDQLGHVYIGGGTESDTFPVTSNAHQQKLGWLGWQDGFITKLDTTGSLNWSTYFGGHGFDVINSIEVYKNESIYLTGRTNSYDWLNNVSKYQPQNNGTTDIFLSKLNANGLLEWHTYFGGSLYEEVYDLKIIDNRSLVIVGCSNSSTNITSKDAFRPTYTGGKSAYGLGDAFLSQFSLVGYRWWSTYFGDSLDESYTSVSVDDSGNVWAAGFTKDTTNIVVGNVWQNKHGGAKEDGFVTEYKFGNDTCDAAIYEVLSPRDTLCPGPYEVKIKLLNHGTDTIFSDSVGLNILSNKRKQVNWTGILPPDSLVEISLGTYNFLRSGMIDLEIQSYRTNGKFDSSISNNILKYNIYVADTPIAKAGKDAGICPGNGMTIGTSNSNNVAMGYQWTSIPSGYTDSVETRYIYPKKTTNYILTVSNYSTVCPRSATDTIKVTIIERDSVYIDTSICDGSVFKVGKNSYTKSGFYSNLLQNKYKCDSFVYLNLKIKKTDLTVFTATICNNGSYTFRGKTYYQSKFYFDTLTNIYGCDSIIKLDLRHYSTPWSVIQGNLCGADSLLINGKKYSQTGFYYDTVKSSLGCDSVVWIFITNTTKYTDTTRIRMCPGFPYYIKKQKITTSGFYYDSLRTPEGCDSIKVYDITFWPPPSPQIYVSKSKACIGDTIILSTAPYVNYLWNTQQKSPTINVTQDGQYIVYVTDSNGCKNVSGGVNIKFLSLPKPLITISNNPICKGESTTLSTSNFKSYNWSNGDTTRSITVKDTGPFTVIVADSNNCKGKSTSASIQINPLPTPNLWLSNNQFIADSGYFKYWWYINNKPIPNYHKNTFTPTTIGLYKVSAEDSIGCSGMSQEIQFNWAGISNINDAIKIYPNPTCGMVHFEFNTNKKRTLCCYDALGKLLYINTIYDITFETNFLENSAEGNYILMLSDDESIFHYMIKKIN